MPKEERMSPSMFRASLHSSRISSSAAPPIPRKLDELDGGAPQS